MKIHHERHIMTIQILAGSLLVAAGMSYGNSSQIHAPLPNPVANSAMPTSADPYIQLRLRQKQAREQDRARLHADNAARIARGVAARSRQLAANNSINGGINGGNNGLNNGLNKRQRPPAQQKVSLPVPAQ